jgi:hypothetical protein
MSLNDEIKFGNWQYRFGIVKAVFARGRKDFYHVTVLTPHSKDGNICLGQNNQTMPSNL